MCGTGCKNGSGAAPTLEPPRREYRSPTVGDFQTSWAAAFPRTGAGAAVSARARRCPMLPPGYEPFLRAICTDPEDDTVRLVFADWLDENGDPERAEFIRLQVRRAQLKASGENPKELKDRDIKLRQEHEERWRRELPLNIYPDVWQRFW